MLEVAGGVVLGFFAIVLLIALFFFLAGAFTDY